MKLRQPCLLALLACLAGSGPFAGCKPKSQPGGSFPSQPSPQPQTPSNPPPVPMPPLSADVVPPDVRFTELHFEKGDAQYLLKVRARNNGPGTAHVNGGCSWRCPAGTILSGGATVVSGGFIVPGAEFSYFGIASGMCVGPPALLNLDCSMDVQGDVNGKPGVRTSSVKWSQQLQIPY